MKLIDYFFSNMDRNMIHKPVRYFDVYDKYFEKYKGFPIRVLEIGVENGGSLRMWKEYFGPKSEIVGIDINPKCKEFECPGIKIYNGDQSNVEFLREIREKELPFNIIIDDGGHFPVQQITSWVHLFKHLTPNGIYLIEDVGTSYMKEYGGGRKEPSSFIEFAKLAVDSINLEDNCGLRGVSFFRDIVVFEKGTIDDMRTLAIGRQMI